MFHKSDEQLHEFVRATCLFELLLSAFKSVSASSVAIFSECELLSSNLLAFDRWERSMRRSCHAIRDVIRLALEENEQNLSEPIDFSQDAWNYGEPEDTHGTLQSVKES